MNTRSIGSDCFRSRVSRNAVNQGEEVLGVALTNNKYQLHGEKILSVEFVRLQKHLILQRIQHASRICLTSVDFSRKLCSDDRVSKTPI